MNDEADWDGATWEGNRRRQHREFLALSFREKLENLERLEAFAAVFGARALARRRSQNQSAEPDRS